MMDEPERNLKKRHSFYTTQTSHRAQSEVHCKSDLNLPQHKCPDIISRKRDVSRNSKVLGEYYKNYEHDEVPVRDSNCHDFSAYGDKSLTNSELDKLEFKVFQNTSQELYTNNSSVSSLENNIKFFKTTVQEIFKNFYASMQDFEIYKKRYQDILAKNQEEALVDMEEFIKDMIHHIMSSESCSNDSRKSNDPSINEVNYTELPDKLMNVNETDVELTDESTIERNNSAQTNTTDDADNLDSVLETYKNDNYLTDSTLDENASKARRSAMKEEIFNIFLLGGNPCVQFKMNDRHLLSEINFKELTAADTVSNHVTSADNLKKLAAKRIEMEKYAKDQQDANVADIEIPVKVSYAKKNIHMNEDFTREREAEKSLISRICSFLCKKFRKTPFS